MRKFSGSVKIENCLKSVKLKKSVWLEALVNTLEIGAIWQIAPKDFPMRIKFALIPTNEKKI